MNEITKDLLREISEWDGEFKGAYNIREDGQCAGRMSSKNIRIESKKDQPGLEIFIAPGTTDETVSIPACVTHGDVDDLVYNDFLSAKMQMLLSLPAAVYILKQENLPGITVFIAFSSVRVPESSILKNISVKVTEPDFVPLIP